VVGDDDGVVGHGGEERGGRGEEEAVAVVLGLLGMLLFFRRRVAVTVAAASLVFSFFLFLSLFDVIPLGARRGEGRIVMGVARDVVAGRGGGRCGSSSGGDRSVRICNKQLRNRRRWHRRSGVTCEGMLGSWSVDTLHLAVPPTVRSYATTTPEDDIGGGKGVVFAVAG